jgi:hypothetical protein
VQLLPDPPTNVGAIAQLGERLLCKQEVNGSIPVGSTRFVLETARAVQREESALHSAFRFFRLLFNNSEETRRVRHSFKGRTHWVRDCINEVAA